MRRSWIVGGVIASAGCGEAAEVPVPGLLEPSCAMTWAAYAVTTVDLPELRDDVLPLGLDVDQRANDSSFGVDNQIGSLLALVTALFPESWDPQAAFNGRLAAGAVHWVVEVGTCADGDEVRVVSAQAADADGDGVLEIVARGVPSVGRGGGATVRGLGWVPIGGLAAGSPTSGTDGWLSGLALTTDLTVTGDRVSGRLAIGLDPDADAAVTPVMNFFNERLVAGTSPGARDIDANTDGVIDLVEMRQTLRSLLEPDLDLGECDELACYAPFDGDRLNDHASLGLGIVATRVALE